MKRAIITIGKAAAEGRAPSHDGEYVEVFHRADGRWAAVDNGGLIATDRTVEDAIAAAEDPAWARGLIDQIVAAVERDDGEPVAAGEVASAAAREYFEGIVGPDAMQTLLDQVRRLKTRLPYAAFSAGGGRFYIDLDLDPWRNNWVCRGATEAECHARAEVWFEPVDD